MKAPDPTPFPIDHLVERHKGVRNNGQVTAPALVLRDRVLDHAALRHGVAQLAGWLAQACPEPGTRVASWAAKGELTCLLPLAATRAGLIHVPINPLLKRAQVAHILADSGARMVIGTSARLASLEAGDLPGQCAAIDERAAMAKAYDAEPTLPLSQADPDDLAAILYTSGSTGKPKGVMVSHANLWLGAVSVAHYLQLRSDDVTLAVLPLAFDYGQNQLLSTWYAGGCVVPLDMLFPADVTKACARHAVTTLAGVPPLWVQLVERDWPSETIASIRRITNSGGALSKGLVGDLRKVFRTADIYPMYGLTEAFRSTFLDPALVDDHPTSMGKAIPFAEVLVMRDDRDPAEPGEEGELVHCGPLVAKGYWRDPARTSQRFRPAPAVSRYGGTAVWSGDRVRRDAHGLLYFVGRRDAMIKSAGNRISPQEIEDAALASGVVTEAVALGIPDDRLGQAVHLVVRGDGDRNHLSKHLQRELPTFMQPTRVHWHDALPRNANGKIDRAAIRDTLLEMVAL